MSANAPADPTSDPTTDLVRALVQNMIGAPDDWTALAMVVRVDDVGRIAGTSGYAYTADGESHATSSRPSRVAGELQAYLADTYAPGQAPPVSLLVQLDRAQGRFRIDFEDTDRSRWKVTPTNIDEIVEELRPRFE